jgi:hypothetical protein
MVAEEKVTQNREDIIRIEGHLKLIKIVWTVSFMVLGLILKAVYTGLIS